MLKKEAKITRKLEESPEITPVHAEVRKHRRERFGGRPNLIGTFSKPQERVMYIEHTETDQQGVAQ